MSGAAPTREVAYRVFADEFAESTYSYAESDDERAPQYLVTPTGARINRIFVVGVLTETEEVSDGVLRARIVDPTGAFVLYAGQYQPEALAFFERADPPVFVSLTGKARTFEPDGSDRVLTSLRPERVNEVDADTRDSWVVQTALHTLERTGLLAQALELDAREEELSVQLTAAGVKPGLAAGIPRAIREYEPTTGYLEALQQLSLDAVRVVAGEIDEVTGGAGTPSEGGEGEVLTGFTDVSLASTPSDTGESGSTGREEPEETQEAAPETMVDEEQREEEPVESSEADEPEPDEEAESEPAAEPESEPETDAETEPDGESESKSEAEPESEPESEPEAEPDSGLEAEPESDPQTEPDDEAESEPDEPETEPATETETEAGTGPREDGPEEPDESPDKSDTEGEEATGPEDAAESEELYELSEAERAEVEENYDVGFESGADIGGPEETPDIDPEASDVEADESPPGTDGDGEAAAPADEHEETDSSTDSGESPADSGESPADSEASELSDAEPEDLVVDTLQELGDGGGVPRTELIETLQARHELDEEEIEDAIEAALLGGRCFESGSEDLKPI